MMTANDLRCPKCGAVARDVDVRKQIPTGTFVLWACVNGHGYVSGPRSLGAGRGFEVQHHSVQRRAERDR